MFSIRGISMSDTNSFICDMRILVKTINDGKRAKQALLQHVETKASNDIQKEVINNPKLGLIFIDEKGITVQYISSWYTDEIRKALLD